MIVYFILMLFSIGFGSSMQEELRAQSQNEVSFEILKIECAPDRISNDHQVIEDNFQYTDLLSQDSECTNFPDIDFSKKILIVYEVKQAGCQRAPLKMTIHQDGDKMLTTVYVLADRQTFAKEGIAILSGSQ
jgi:hypothetical protein